MKLLFQGLVRSLLFLSLVCLSTTVSTSYPNVEQMFEEIGQISIGDATWDVQVVDNLAYIADQGNGLTIIDVKDPSSPTEVSVFREGTGGPHAIVTNGTILYMPDWIDGLEIIDVTDPYTPQKIGQYKDEGQSYDVAFNAHGNIAYVAHEDWGLLILDVSDPRQPKKLGQLNDGGTILQVCSYDNFVFASDMEQGLELIDASDPRNPLKVKLFEEYRGVGYIDGTIAYGVTSDNRGVILDIKDIENPIEISHFSKFDYIRDIMLVDDIAYIVAYSEGIFVYNISNIDNPINLGRYNPEGKATGIYVVENFIYAVYKEDGLRIIKFDPLGEQRDQSSDSIPGFEFLIILPCLIIIPVFNQIKRIIEPRGR